MTPFNAWRHRRRRCHGPGARSELGVGANNGCVNEAQVQDAGGGTLTVKVTNWREADLVELQVAESGSANWKKVLGPLKAGQWTWAKVPQSKSCHVNLRGKRAQRLDQLARSKSGSRASRRPSVCGTTCAYADPLP
jgi:hypothetical protein